MYADTDFWVALLKGDDWLANRADRVGRYSSSGPCLPYSEW